MTIENVSDGWITTTAIKLAIKLTIKLKTFFCNYNKQPCKCCTTVAALISILL